MAQICNELPALLPCVERLRICAMQPPSEQDDSNGKGWRKVIHLFKGTKQFQIDGDHLKDIVLALHQHEVVPPALHKLCVLKPEPLYEPLWLAVEPFIYSHRLSDRFIEVEYERQWISELHATGTKFAQCHFFNHALMFFEQDLLSR